MHRCLLRTGQESGRGAASRIGPFEIKTGFLYVMAKAPTIDLSECTDCEACLELCPTVFRRSNETGQIEVADLEDYPEEEIAEAIAMCPCDCIAWEEP